MANISEAAGTFNLIGDWSKEDIRALSFMLYRHNFFNYNTYTRDCVQEVYEDLLEEKTISFSGSGRWSYYINLERLYDWALLSDNEEWKSLDADKGELAGEENFSAYNELFQKLLVSMHEKKLELSIEYADYEGGCDFLVKVNATLVSVFNLSTSKYELEIHAGNEDYEANLKNYELVFDTDMTDTLRDVAQSCVEFIKGETFKPEDVDAVFNMIEKHENYYGLTVYPWFEEAEELPEKLFDDAKKLLA